MSRIAYVNGQYLPQRDASVNIEDRGYQFADGIYEVIYIHRGRLIDETLHMDRLERSLRAIRITEPMPRAALMQVLAEVARRNRVQNGLLYMQVTRGVARRDHAFPAGTVRPALVVTVKRLPAYPQDVEKWTYRAITHPDERWARCDIKSVALLPNVLARQAARDAGANEAILVDADGMVTEGASTTVWIVDRDGVLRTRHLDHAILPGCTRDALLTLLQTANLRYEQRAFSKTDLTEAREAFVTSATSFVRPVLEVDGLKIGDGRVGPVVRTLFSTFSEHVAA